MPLTIVHFLFFCRCVAGMAEKLREAAARGDVARVARLLDEDIKPLPDEVSFLFFSNLIFSSLVHNLLSRLRVFFCRHRISFYGIFFLLGFLRIDHELFLNILGENQAGMINQILRRTTSFFALEESKVTFFCLFHCWRI